MAERIARNVIVRTVESEMKQSFLDYSMSVIMSRALPDVRDGLKPVHRRILYAMNEMGLTHDKPFKKSARVVGEVLGKYHPHGDQAVYDALVRMAQDFSLRYPLIDGQGNFGSIDGDSPAAMRYTEVRMSKIAKLLLEDIEKDTVDWMDNFDGTLKEPTVLPSKLPNLLVNGSSGIAVGMATNIPPHNLSEVVDGIIKFIENPDITTEELMEYIKGPDFPTGGIIYGREGIEKAYETGKGIIKIRAKVKIEGKGRKRIVVTEIPYMVNKADLLREIADLVKNKKIEGILDLRDESDRKGLRIVIELRRDAIERVVLNQLFEHTNLQVTFGILNLAIVDGEPKILSLKDMIKHFVDHRIEIVTRRAEYELRKAKERLHILDGLLIALRRIDDVIETIRKSRDVEEAKKALMEKFSLTELQAKSILDMRLQRLTGLEIEKVKKEHEETTRKIKELEEMLGSKERILEEIKRELLEIKREFGDKRRTLIEEESALIKVEDLIPKKRVMITITRDGYVKRISIGAYRTHHRGGKGLVGMGMKEGDAVIDSFIATTHDFVLFFTNTGKVYCIKAYKIPEGSRQSRGRAIVNLIPKMNKGEKIQVAIPVSEFDEKHFLILVTKKGFIKKTPLLEFMNIRANGIRAIKLDKDDELVSAKLSNGKKEVVIATSDGQACRFEENEVRPMLRNARGVQGISLNEGDRVVSLCLVEGEKDLLTITENGYGKRSPLSSYRKTHRGSKGVRTIITNERNGKVIFVREVDENDEILLTSEGGMVARIPVKDIRRQGRNTVGVRIMKLSKGDKVATVAKLS